MSIKIFNAPGLFIALAAVAAAVALHLCYPFVSDAVVFAVAAILCLGLDLLWRAGKGQRHWFHFNRGGSVLYLPVWLFGALWLGLAAYQAYHGPIPALTRASQQQPAAQAHR